MKAKPVWKLTKNQATVEGSQLSLHIDVKNPNHGLLDVKFDDKPLANAKILQISPEPPAPSGGETIIDAYARGEDLVVTYAQTPARSIRPQYTWRVVNPSEEIAGIQLTVATQTSLLDSDPSVRCATAFLNAEAEFYDGSRWQAVGGDSTNLGRAVGLFLFRPAGEAGSYAEMVFPSDYAGASLISHGDGIELQHELFPKLFLEKGVIRKGRLQGLVMPREKDEELAVQAWESFAAAVPPLTT